MIEKLKPGDKVLVEAEVKEIITSSGESSGSIQSIRVRIKTSGFTSTVKKPKGELAADEHDVWIHVKSLPDGAVKKKE